MGDAADDAIDMALDRIDRTIATLSRVRPTLTELRYMPQATHWQTRDGRRLRIADMEPDHARNALAMIRRRMGEERADASPGGRALIARLREAGDSG